MNVLFVSAELAPLVKTGGLADVAAALPPALRNLGHDVRVVIPRYRRVRERNIAQIGPIAATFIAVGDHQEELRIWRTTLNRTPVYLLDIPAAFERPAIYGEADDARRFILFSRGVMALVQHLREIDGWNVDVLHANDWPAGLLPQYLKTFYAYTFGHVASVYTIHNLGYQGIFAPEILALSGVSNDGMVEGRAGAALAGEFNFMARGTLYADVVSTVSPTYAQEILTPEYGYRLDGLLRSRGDRVVGIQNGIDYEFFDPELDPHIFAPFSATDTRNKTLCKAALQRECGLAEEDDRPLFGMVTRLAEQKGLDLLLQILPWFIEYTTGQLVLLGTGQPDIERACAAYMQQHPDRIKVYLTFDAALAQRIYAGCDAFLMPSRYEPGGLGHLIALRYGTVPVVRATGGLNDTVREGFDGNGFRFHPYEASYLRDAIERSIRCFRQRRDWSILRQRGMQEDHSWVNSARAYVALYTRALSLIGR